MSSAVPGFTRVAGDDEVREGEVASAEVAGREIVLVRVGGELFALEGLCSHGHAYLCEGELAGHELVCPLHAGAFDVRNGRPTAAPCVEALRTYAVKVVAGAIFVADG